MEKASEHTRRTFFTRAISQFAVKLEGSMLKQFDIAMLSLCLQAQKTPTAKWQMNILIYLLLGAAIYINLRAAYSNPETLNCMHLKVTLFYTVTLWELL